MPVRLQRRIRAHLLAASLCVTGLLGASAVYAQTSSDSAAAQALFDDAKRLMSEGKALEACPKLEESQRLDPGSGTLLNLAKCYEQTDRLASAWTKYLEAATAAKATGNTEREETARKLAQALSPRLSNLVIVVESGSQPAGLEVTRDGAIVGAPQLGVPIPADAGEHVIEAKAPGKNPWRTVAVVRGEASTTRVSIPELAQAPEQPGTQTDTAPLSTVADSDGQASGFGTQRVLALVAGGIGVVGIGVGTVFGLKSKSKHDEAAKYCTGGACTDQLGVTAGEEAKDAGNVSTVAMIVGAAGIVGGLALWFTAPDSSSTRVGIGPRGIQLAGEF